MDDVNALHFSPDGQVLAIGTDNGLVLFYHHQTRRLIYKLIGDVPVTALMWHPTEQYALFVGGGDGSCNLHRFSDTRFVSFLTTQSPSELTLAQERAPGLSVVLGLPSPGIVESIDYDVCSQSLAVAVGKHVAITQANSTFTSDGSIVAHNLSHGFDKYDIRTLSLVHTFSSPSAAEQNVALPVIPAGDGQLLFGTSIGHVKLCDVSGQMSQTLQPSGTFNQSHLSPGFP
ncbi:hypothetical protein EIP86_008937 [Pleurotus ostreatoroseus]|nr:hypothetical protein EIP86_008937 [Pleurotus ostreatoroseus]